MNITLSIDEKLAEQARKVAQSMGKSLNQVIRDYLERLTGQQDAVADMAELRRLSAASQGHSKGWKFDRDELHERP